MRTLCRREALLEACQLTSVAIPAKEVKPILRNLKAIAGDGRCTLVATDLEVGIRLDVQGLTIQEPGEAILPAAKLIQILREARDDELDIEADPSTCMVRGTTSPLEFEMPSEDPANFPDVPAFTADQYHELTAGQLRDMIRRTIFAAAVENPRYAVTGVLWELEDNQARLIATDGRRLAVDQGTATPFGGHDTKGQTPVVPTKAMGLLERNLSDAEEIVRVSFRPNEVLFKTERAMVYSRLVEGRYPAYREVFPKKATSKVPLSVGPFYSAVRQAAIMTDDESKKVTFSFTKGKLTLQASGAETGRSKVELPLEYEGRAVDIRFDPKYLTDMLRVLDEDAALTLELVDGTSPALFRTGNYSYIVMPLT